MNSLPPLSKQSIVVATGRQIFSELNKESIILDMPSGTYYGLNQVGKSIWQLIQAPRSVNEIVSSLLKDYAGVSPEVCERDVIELLSDLYSHRLIEVQVQTEPQVNVAIPNQS